MINFKLRFTSQGFFKFSKSNVLRTCDKHGAGPRYHGYRACASATSWCRRPGNRTSGTECWMPRNEKNQLIEQYPN